MTVEFKKLRDVRTPSRSYTEAAGWDFYVPSSFDYLPGISQMPNAIKWESKVIRPNESLLIPSGISIKIPAGYALRFDNKSSMAAQGFIVGATIVDSDYQGEVHLHVWNVSKNELTVKCGQKLVQAVFFKTENFTLYEVPKHRKLFASASARGENGFGSANRIDQ